jgi:hypothetical protein
MASDVDPPLSARAELSGANENGDPPSDGAVPGAVSGAVPGAVPGAVLGIPGIPGTTPGMTPGVGHGTGGQGGRLYNVVCAAAVVTIVTVTPEAASRRLTHRRVRKPKHMGSSLRRRAPEAVAHVLRRESGMGERVRPGE